MQLCAIAITQSHSKRPKAARSYGKMTEDKISNIVIGAAIEVHRELGPCLLESAYQECLYNDLIDLGLSVEKERAMPIVYKETKLDHGHRVDLLIENKVVKEIKTVDVFTEVHTAQLLTYYDLANLNLDY